MRLLLRLARSRWTPVTGTGIGVLLLLHSVDPVRAAAGLRHTDPRLALLGVALTAVGVIAAVAVWGVLVRGIGHGIAWRHLTSWYLQGVFIGHVMPTAAAGDALRVVEVGRVAGHGRSLASLAASRMSTTLAMALGGLIGAVILRSAVGIPVLAGAACYAGFMLLAWMIALRLHGLTQLIGRRTSPLCRLVVRVASPFTDAFDALRHLPHTVVLGIAIALAGWAANLLALQSFAASLDVHVGWSAFAVAVPLSLLASTAPIAVNGMGVREGVLIGVLARLGVDHAHAGSLAIILDLQLAPFALLGGGLALLGRRRPRSAELAAVAARRGRLTA